MRNINITFEKPRVVVNGIEFDVLKSDAEIVQDMIDIDINLNKINNQVKLFIEKQKYLFNYIDELLGEGASEKVKKNIEDISGSKFGAASAVKICESIISEAGKAYSDAFKISYGEEI